MHADGGVIAQFFLWGAMVDISAAQQELGVDPDENVEASIYIIRNSQIEAAPELVERNLDGYRLALDDDPPQGGGHGRSDSRLGPGRTGQRRFQLCRHSARTRRGPAAKFEPAEMRRLFDLGHAIATGPEPWRKEPPSFLQ